MTAFKISARRKEEDSFRGSMVENRGFGSRFADAMIILILALSALICVIPIWHVLMSSVSDGQQLFVLNGLSKLATDGKMASNSAMISLLGRAI